MSFLNNIPLIAARSRRQLVVDFGRSVLKIACLESCGEGVKFSAFDACAVASGAATFEETAVDFIRSFIRRARCAPGDTHIVISDTDAVVLRHIAMPVLPRQEMLEALRWQLGEEAPFDAAEATVDGQLCREYVDEEGARKADILGVMVKTDFIEGYLRIISLCGLKAASVTLGIFHYGRLISEKNRDGVRAVLDCGFGEATLGVYRGDRLLFARRLAFSSHKLTQSLVGAFISDKTRVELVYDDAERVKRSYGIPEETGGLLEGHLASSEIFSLMRPHLEELARELKLSFDYFTAHIDEETPLVLYLTGGGAQLKNLRAFLQRVLPVPVEELCLSSLADAGAAAALWRFQAAAVAGAGFHNIPINLLPQRLRLARLAARQMILLRLLGVVVGIILIGSLLFSRVRARGYERRLAAIKEQMACADNIESLMEVIGPRQDLRDRIQKMRLPADGLMTLIAHLIPRAATLEELVVDNGARALFLRGTVKGLENTVTESLVTGFMQALEASSFFREAALVSSEKTSEGAVFEIRCDFASP